MWGGTGSESENQDMPYFLPDRAEAGTLNVVGIAGLGAGIGYLQHKGIENIYQREHRALQRCVQDLHKKGFRVFSGDHQAATVSFVSNADCEKTAEILAESGIAVRAGLHCAPLAHESAGTLQTGTVRISFGHDANPGQNEMLRRVIAKSPD
jgi:selenocysteine lyase/cysteine desulfurase